MLKVGDLVKFVNHRSPDVVGGFPKLGEVGLVVKESGFGLVRVFWAQTGSEWFHALEKVEKIG